MKRVDFHDKFDEGTILKLELIREYIREWLPVFLVKKSFSQVNIFDFFAGPSTDDHGNPGSPLIILEESENYCLDRGVSSQIQLNLYFNDNDRVKTERLNELVEPYRKRTGWRITVRNLDFAQSFKECLPAIRDDGSANLLIVDQFGFKQMTPEVFSKIATCKATDLICFMSSSNIRRFVTTDAVQRNLKIPPGILNAHSTDAHRYICDYFKSYIPVGKEFYVAPVSIKKQANYYGLLFGSGSLTGLEKILKICWGVDKITGEANYPIDNDRIAISGGQLSFDEEDNIPQKQKDFKTNHKDYILKETRSNKDIYRFTLESRFLPKHAVRLLQSLEKEQYISVNGLSSTARTGYYISWKHYQESQAKAWFSIRI